MATYPASPAKLDIPLPAQLRSQFFPRGALDKCRVSAINLSLNPPSESDRKSPDPGIPVRRLERECATASDELIWDGERRLCRRQPTIIRTWP